MAYGPVVGTYKHTALKAEIEALGDPRLRAEVSFLNGAEVEYGKTGSVRLDVVLFGENGEIICAWDLKTGKASLTED